MATGRGVAARCMSATVALACTSAITSCGSSATDETAAVTDREVSACMVAGLGGMDDRSYNAMSWAALESAKERGLVDSIDHVAPKVAADFGPAIDSMVNKRCTFIVTVGFDTAEATEKAAKANPGERFIMVDYQYVDGRGNPREIPNVKTMVFNAHEAAFMAGYAAAAYTTTGVVGTWGGAQIPPVTIFMDGFAAGVAYYNERQGDDVVLLGWDEESQEGSFVGDFTGHSAAASIMQHMIDSEADVIFPVAGGLVLTAAEVAQDDDGVAIVWPDSDGAEVAPEFADIIFTSVMKNVEAGFFSIEDAILFDYEPFVGDLWNGGVSIAPFRSHEVPRSVIAELNEIQRKIIADQIPIESPAAYQ